MKDDSIFQTEIYLNSFGIESGSFVFDDKKYIYELRGKVMYILSTCIKKVYLTKELASYIFNTFAGVKRIIFKKTLDSAFSSRYTICVKALDDNILDLSEFVDIDDYLSHLGKKTRQHLRNYKRRFDTFCETTGNVFEMQIPNAQSEEFKKNCESIYKLNNDRCLSKGFSSGTDRRLVDVCAVSGGAICYCLNQSIIAGTMFSLHGNSLYLHIVAHDNKYSDYNVGNLVLLDTIEYAITHGVTEFHFLWGECEYKKRFGAKKHDLFDLVVYKSAFLYTISKVTQKTDRLIKYVKRTIIRILKRFGIVEFLKNTLLNIFGNTFVDKIGRWMYSK